YVILRRDILRLAWPPRKKNIDLLVYLHDANQRRQLETLASKTGYRITVLSSFDNNFPALLARSRYFLSGFGSSFYEALHLNTTPLCWPDSKAHLRDVRKFYEKIGLPVKVLQSSADIESVLLPILQNDSVINPKIQDGTPQIVKILAELVENFKLDDIL
ncbi:MAG: hypothetical protein J7K96_00430, partial [Desulfobacteraceae bacterium]|nr:hypothetical protein [Desulfobacteraceae bacterium]